MSTDTTSRSHYDVVVVGGGHNGLVAAAYLARAGLSTLVLERLDHTGGAAISAQAFPGHPVRLSRYSYLVSVMPDALMADLDLDVTLTSRRTASYTPTLRDGVPGGLFVQRPERRRTAESFASLTGGEEEYAAWQRFYGELEQMAGVLAPTFLSPLPTERDLQAQVGETIWRDVVERPLGEAVERRFRDDTVRARVLGIGEGFLAEPWWCRTLVLSAERTARRDGIVRVGVAARHLRRPGPRQAMLDAVDLALLHASAPTVYAWQRHRPALTDAA
ncbi:NAD(P)-binding protein [uncultured Nocardioides sp.]|uniref:NAD(P)-binding protein n=1 Tax=uncultured Nocardioides sp. TaxID=198441 RepID=UPI0034588A9A